MNRTSTPLFTSLVFSLLGTLMSGYLSYWVLFGPSCKAGPISWLSCGTNGPVKLAGIPTCVFGFAMFLSVVILSLVALQRSSAALRKATLTIATIGVLFSLGLSMYELFWLKWTTLPACVYGFFFYVGIWIATKMSRFSPVAPATPIGTNVAQ